LINWYTSSARQATVLEPREIFLGKMPLLTPLSHDVRLMGMRAGIGGFALGFPIICQSLKNEGED
jgi:hypothetical protein